MSRACVQEVIRCASQMHEAKPYFRVVIICKEPDEVAPLLRMIADDDPYIRASARAIHEGRVDSRINVSHEVDPEEVSETFLKRLGEIMGAQQQRRTRRARREPIG